MYHSEKANRKFLIGIIVVITVIIALIITAMLVLPIYKRWSASLMGQAELNQAEYNRQIATLEAKQKMESAEYLNKAEIIRAEGVAKANQIIAEGLGGPEGYLRYLWIQALSQDNKATPQVIYIPTEAGMPILEAGKRK